MFNETVECKWSLVEFILTLMINELNFIWKIKKEQWKKKNN